MLVFHRLIFVEKFWFYNIKFGLSVLADFKRLQFVGSVKLATVQRKYLEEIENLLLLLLKRKLEA